jgi:hypothetical protein
MKPAGISGIKRGYLKNKINKLANKQNKQENQSPVERN